MNRKYAYVIENNIKKVSDKLFIYARATPIL